MFPAVRQDCFSIRFLTVEVCDASGDAMKNRCRLNNHFVKNLAFIVQAALSVPTEKGVKLHPPSFTSGAVLILLQWLISKPLPGSLR